MMIGVSIRKLELSFLDQKELQTSKYSRLRDIIMIYVIGMCAEVRLWLLVIKSYSIY